MGDSTQRCYYCHEITERTSDGDRAACSACGRPYPAVPQPKIGLPAVSPAATGTMTCRIRERKR